jgi:predicted glycosyl hydrolase (DUF1957 family)
MMTFATAAAAFATARNKDRGKPTENRNTVVVKVNDTTYGIKLYNTVVVNIHQDGTYTLNTGGWQTVTTKDRINNYSPARVYQRNGEWYMNDDGKFWDGVKIDATGRVLNSPV